MNFSDMPPDMAKHLAGPLGSLVALHWIKGPFSRKLTMFIAGWALSYYAAPALADWLSFSEGLSGFLLGVFGMAIVDKLFETWESFELGTLLKAWLQKVLGLKEGN